MLNGLNPTIAFTEVDEVHILSGQCHCSNTGNTTQ